MVTNTKRSVAVSALFIEVDDQTVKHVVLKRQRLSSLAEEMEDVTRHKRAHGS